MQSVMTHQQLQRDPEKFGRLSGVSQEGLQ